MTTCYVKPIVFESPNRKGDLFPIERGDETALFDPLDKGRIDNPTRTGLFGLGVLSRHNIPAPMSLFSCSRDC
jgi:hypothetical protein